MTSKRTAILRILQESEGHLTAEDIFLLARKEYPGIVLATVYNNLHALTEAGLIRRVRTEEGADFYDRTPTKHDHAVCAKCGKMFDLPGGDLAPLLESRSGCPILSYHLTANSLCPDCNHTERKRES